MQNKRIYGSMGERVACKYLEKNCFEIINCNFRAGRLGEIDIIAKEDEYICFVEVKTRSSTYFGMPSQAVNYKKQQNIKKIAQIYINKYNIKDMDLRFDVVEVLVTKIERGLKVEKINLIRNAFY